MGDKLKSKVQYWYEEKYKVLMILPFLLVILALAQISVQYYTTGDFVHRGVTLKGGSTITITKDVAMGEEGLETFLQSKFPTEDISVRTITSAGRVVGLSVDSDVQEKAEIDSLIKVIKQQTLITDKDYNAEVIGSSLGANFFKQTIFALLVSFLLMGLVVILYFRIIIPSLAVILCAFSDIVVTVAVFNLTGMKLSTAGVAALLMLIGYSVDTDVLLTTRSMRRQEGLLKDRIYSSIKTGLTMTFTTLVVILIALFFVQSDVVKQIMYILLIGLMVDMPMTWIQNVGVLRLYLEKKKYKYND
ncbi:protein translocase subunit SecF [Candidatus Woesearchaeota archaeon]|nr:protein translocase subunit SecF [Candidatus Woesearchaeota archaeon]